MGFTAGIIGLVLGVRTFCQHGLYVVGGSLSDRLGCRSLIVAGALVRATGFLLFGFATTLAVVFVAAVLTGFGGVLFGPASRSYLAQEAVGENRVQTLALGEACTKVGELIGPLVGLALLAVNFQLASLVASGVFTLLALFVLCLLPYRPGLEATSMDSALMDWRHVLSNRVFLLFALGMGGGWLMSNQVYVSLPLEIERLTGSNLGVSVMFTLSCLMVITAQARVTAASRARWRGPRAIVIGLSLMTVSFVLLMIGGVLLPLSAASDGLAAALVTAVNLAPIVLWTLVFTLGVMIAQPFAMDLIPLLGGERRTGTYYGVYFSVAGLGVLAGNPVIGLFIDLARAVDIPSLPWLVPLVIGLGWTVVMRRLNGRGVLPAWQRLGQRPVIAIEPQPDGSAPRSDCQGDSGDPPLGQTVLGIMIEHRPLAGHSILISLNDLAGLHDPNGGTIYGSIDITRYLLTDARVAVSPGAFARLRSLEVRLSFGCVGASATYPETWQAELQTAIEAVAQYLPPGTRLLTGVRPGPSFRRVAPCATPQGFAEGRRLIHEALVHCMAPSLARLIAANRHRQRVTVTRWLNRPAV